MKTVKDILDIADVRYKEACLLFDNGFYDGAFYLVGYSVELALKAKICELLNIDNLFDNNNKPQNLAKEDLKPFRTHNLKTLLLFSGREKKFREEMNNDKTGILFKNWSLIITEWNEECRYLCCKTKNQEDTSNLINAIGNPENGILTWILNN